MSLSNTFENDVMKYLFQTTALSGFPDTSGNVYVSLHTADPGEAGDQTTNEINYTNYLRVYTTRGATGWTVANSTASNAIPIIFAACGAAGSTAAYVGVGTTGAGAGKLMWSGQLTAQLVVTPGVTPSFTTAGLNCVID